LAIASRLGGNKELDHHPYNPQAAGDGRHDQHRHRRRSNPVERHLPIWHLAGEVTIRPELRPLIGVEAHANDFVRARRINDSSARLSADELKERL
jgi:hypothetical protein